MYPRRRPHPDRQAPPGYFGGPGGNPEDNVLVEEKEEEEGQAIGRFGARQAGTSFRVLSSLATPSRPALASLAQGREHQISTQFASIFQGRFCSFTTSLIKLTG